MSERRPLLRRVFPSPALSITVVAFWMVMSSSFDLGQLVLGLLLGVVIPLFAARLVLWDILVCNLRVAAQVLGREDKLKPGFIWVPLDIANIHGIAALTSFITLTPGTVSAALSEDRRHLLVHVLHLEDANALINEIKSRYEAPLMEIFP